MKFVKLHGAGNDYIYVDARESVIGSQELRLARGGTAG